ncbi:MULTISPECIES: copper homeostasis protein CutC [Turicibacter]|uniref:copper homeostasis protein CutC n=1 Tax=Turicibacter TaxID=191303 RepID=UPI0001FDB3E1|nr:MULTISPECIES: copper homeostasis protein CutC [Turicibacter]EGC90910.1 CutC family protein [Turicibacter sp. HGF1]MBP3905179.1 copper homeostasis protein CutC [Turicibacter sp.]MCU7198188.1 copper homeostasis protein CutC [Turicibacter sanguinis]MDB8458235.1 copper homeostasis protein CutC [Turicibacter sanguinis]MDB8555298.1 copper homeostasis protein CutC [Turicibacter sanguinis]
MIYEACVGSYQEAIEAAKRGASRIELCANLLEGGTTPSYGTIIKTRRDVRLPIMVMIRPRGGNFCFNEDEVEIMIEDIKQCKEIGVDGVVIGALKENEIDVKTIKTLVEIAKPLSMTFHMAFDELTDPFKGIDILKGLGINRILTTGKNENALKGKELIKEFIEYANNEIIIMPGKGITTKNREELIGFLQINEVHGTKIV